MRQCSTWALFPRHWWATWLFASRCQAASLCLQTIPTENEEKNTMCVRVCTVCVSGGTNELKRNQSKAFQIHTRAHARQHTMSSRRLFCRRTSSPIPIVTWPKTKTKENKTKTNKQTKKKTENERKEREWNKEMKERKQKGGDWTQNSKRKWVAQKRKDGKGKDTAREPHVSHLL